MRATSIPPHRGRRTAAIGRFAVPFQHGAADRRKQSSVRGGDCSLSWRRWQSVFEGPKSPMAMDASGGPCGGGSCVFGAHDKRAVPYFYIGYFVGGGTGARQQALYRQKR